MIDLIVVGAGPAGISAAAHAKQLGLSVLLLEKGEVANTIFNYQKRKHVMAEPAMIPLRSPVPFEAGTRESLLDAWNRALTTIGVDLHRPEAVTAIQRQADGFQVVTDKATYHARYVILAIGIQGNPRRMNVPGETLPHVTTRLVDPSIYENEDILVVGAGDAAIEGVLALCEKNRVSVVNRNAEFYRLKDALDREINKRVASGQVTAFHSAAVERVEEGHTYLKLPDRTVKVKADLVVVRIGAEIPRKFLDTIGIAFTSADPTAPPQLTERYETTIPGLFMIGAVAGCLDGEAIITTGVGQHQMWAAQFYQFQEPRRYISSLGLGAMGFGYPAALGAKVACPDREVIDIDGDGSFVMNVQELATAHIEKIAAKAMILNNQHLGMVVQWEDRFYGSVRGNTILGDENNVGSPDNPGALYPDFVKIAAGFGVKGRRVLKKSELREAIQEMLDHDGPYVLDIIVPYTEHVLPMIPAGRTVKDMLLK